MKSIRCAMRMLIPTAVLLIAGCGLFDGSADKTKLIQIAIWEDQATLHGGDLLTYLSDRSVQVRRRAAIAIGRIGDTSAYLSLTGILVDQDTIVRAHAALSLGLLRHKPGTPEIYQHLKSEENGFVLQYLLWTMGRLYAQDYGDSLLEFLSHPDPRVRRRTALAINAMTYRAGGDAVAALLDDPDSLVRRDALRALDRLVTPEHVEAILPWLESTNDEMRGLAAMALGRAKDTAHREQLLSMLDEPNRWIRIAAVFGLGSLRDTLFAGRIAPYLLTEQDPGVLAQLTEGVGWHWQSVAVPYLEKLRDHPDLGVRVKLVTALTRSLRGEALAALEPFLDDPAWPVRAALPKQLSFLAQVNHDNSDAVSKLIKQLARDSVAAVRMSAINTGMTLANAVYDAVNAALYDEKPLVRYYAYNVYPFVGGRLPFDTLLQWYKNYQHDTRPDLRMALLALTANLSGSVQIGETQRQIFTLGITDPDRHVREYAAAVWLKFREDHRGEIGVFDSPINEQTYDEYYGLYPEPPRVRFTTSRGEIQIELYPAEAPRSVHHFLSLVREGFYDQTPVGLTDNTRTVYLGDRGADGWGVCDRTVRDENTLRQTTRGSLVWRVSQHHDARSVFGICLRDQPANDFKVTVFGRVVSGMDVVEQLRPLDTIERVEVISKTVAQR